MPKVEYNSSQGLVQKAGSGIDFSTFPFTSKSTDITTIANNTGSLPGLYVLNAGAIATVKMPAATEYPGGMFIFRNGSSGGYANILTGSDSDSSGLKVFAAYPGTTANLNANGSKLTLATPVGSSVALVSDGNKFLVMAASGSFTIDGT